MSIWLYHRQPIVTNLNYQTPRNTFQTQLADATYGCVWHFYNTGTVPGRCVQFVLDSAQTAGSRMESGLCCPGLCCAVVLDLAVLDQDISGSGLCCPGFGSDCPDFAGSRTVLSWNCGTTCGCTTVYCGQKRCYTLYIVVFWLKKGILND